MNSQAVVNVATTQFPSEIPTSPRDFAPSVRRSTRQTELLGLPCASCRAYYPGKIEVCPICGGLQRITGSNFRAS
jgi:hypothetical protein